MRECKKAQKSAQECEKTGDRSETRWKVRRFESPNVEEAQGPRGVLEVWQTLGLETPVFGSVALLGLTGEFSDVWQGKELGDRGRRAGVKPEKESGDRRGCVAANTGTG